MLSGTPEMYDIQYFTIIICVLLYHKLLEGEEDCEKSFELFVKQELGERRYFQ